MPCCPIEVGEFKESEAIPDDASYDCEQTSEAMRPLALESDKAQQDIQKQCRPELPADGVFGVSEEVADFEGLLDLFEEGFDAPAAAIQIADAGSSPFKVIGQEDHSGPLPVNLNPCLDTPEPLGILRSGLRRDQSDLVVTDDIAFWFTQSFATDVVAHVVLRPRNPEDATLAQIEEIGEVDVSLVEDGNLARLQPSTQGQCPRVVMVGGLLYDGERREEGLQVQSQMHLCCSLPATVFGPVHAVGNQSDGRRVDCVNRPLKTAGQATIAACRTELRAEGLKVAKDRPEQFLHHVAIAVLVRMRERIAARRNSTPNRSKFSSMVAKAVTDIVQSNRMSELRKQKAHHLTPRRKGSSLFVYTMLLRKFCRQMRRDEFTKLMQCAAVMLGRRYVFHTSDSLVGIRRRPPLLSELKHGSQLHPVG